MTNSNGRYELKIKFENSSEIVEYSWDITEIYQFVNDLVDETVSEYIVTDTLKSTVLESKKLK